MVIGGGLLATAFADRFANKGDAVIFASGVSNSQECSRSAFMREKSLLDGLVRDDNRRIVYFSTCSLYDPELENTPYVIHKRDMESLVSQAPYFTIFRLPQVVGKTNNSKTLTNFIYTKILQNEHFNVWRYAKRNIIDVSDVSIIAEYILRDESSNKMTINIACPTSISIIELIKIFEVLLAKKASFSIVDTGGSYQIDTDFAGRAAIEMGIAFNDFYVEKVLRKYYGK
jgi:nucleoside-diphosphate-sugar epimerase